MKQITFYLDFISPYAYLAFERLPEALKGISHSVIYRPVLFAGMLKHHGQLGPAEIAPKRDWTYRHVLWLAQSLGIPMQMPQAHPFSPLLPLRLALAVAGEGSAPNRYVCESIFRHVWRGGDDATDPQRLAALAAQLDPKRDPQDPDVKAALQANTQQAIAHGVFGVPALEVDDRVFWGLDALPMLRDYLTGGAWFDGPAWDGVEGVGTAVTRPR
ncbi:MAG: 2-hydroxychromene-2-carboxylate isomerase [Burkholderiales bacterium]|nr:MAG: 2-hydroxychromene-2-carboxylate isomerase [Burkholderiales bacterium]